jgi:hypothetical protein
MPFHGATVGVTGEQGTKADEDEEQTYKMGDVIEG